MAGAFHNMHINDLIGRALVTFCAFVRRVLGEGKFQDLFFCSEQLPNLISLAHKRTSKWGNSPFLAVFEPYNLRAGASDNRDCGTEI